jgi:hypothetical protein
VEKRMQQHMTKAGRAASGPALRAPAMIASVNRGRVWGPLSSQIYNDAVFCTKHDNRIRGGHPLVANG